MVREVRRAAGSGALIAASVVGDEVASFATPSDSGETSGSIQTPVDRNHEWSVSFSPPHGEVGDGGYVHPLQPRGGVARSTHSA